MRSYYAAKAAGRCGHCHKLKVSRGVLCAACAKRHNDGQNKRYRERVAAGICDWCREPHADGTVYCADCREQRKFQPSRQPAVVKSQRGDRTREYQRRNKRRAA